MFQKLYIFFMVVSFSIKPGDQTDEIEIPNLFNKTELAKR